MRRLLLGIRLLLGSIGWSKSCSCGLHTEVERHDREERCDDRCPGFNTHAPNGVMTCCSTRRERSSRTIESVFPLVMPDLDPNQYSEGRGLPIRLRSYWSVTFLNSLSR